MAQKALMMDDMISLGLHWALTSASDKIEARINWIQSNIQNEAQTLSTKKTYLKVGENVGCIIRRRSRWQWRGHQGLTYR